MTRQIKIEVLGDSRVFRRSLRDTERDATSFAVRVSRLKPSVKVDANTREFDQKIVKIRGSATDLAGKKVTIAFGANVDRGELAHKAEAVAKTVHPEVDVKIKADTKQGERALKSFGRSVKNFNKSMMAAGNVIKLLKFPAIIAGAAAAGGAVTALSAQAIGLVSALMPLTG